MVSVSGTVTVTAAFGVLYSWQSLALSLLQQHLVSCTAGSQWHCHCYSSIWCPVQLAVIGTVIVRAAFGVLYSWQSVALSLLQHHLVSCTAGSHWHCHYYSSIWCPVQLAVSGTVTITAAFGVLYSWQSVALSLLQRHLVSCTAGSQWHCHCYSSNSTALLDMLFLLSPLQWRKVTAYESGIHSGAA